MKRVVAVGEIMGRLATPGHARFRQAMPGTLGVTFAGAEASVAASIAYLGGDAAFVTALPDHAIADACVEDLRSIGLDTRPIVRTENGRLGLYFLESGANQRPSKIIYDREGSSIAITPPEAYDWPAILDGADWLVVSGITPALSRNAADVTETAMRQASELGVRIACDINYRGKLWRWDPAHAPPELARRTMRRLMPMVDLFVGGRQDAASILDADPDVPLPGLVRDLARRYPRTAYVALTLRAGASASRNEFGGLLYDRATDQIHVAPEPERFYRIDHIVDRIGTGDAFTAGLLFSLITPELSPPGRAIRFATAAACLAHSVEGDFNGCTRGEIEQLMAGDDSGRVER